MGTKTNGPKVLIFDVETSPLLGYVWQLWKNDISLNQINTDWHMLSWAAKWLGDPPSKIMYMDQRNAKNIDDDKVILKGIWDLLNEADIVITHNGIDFDTKKLNARFILQGFTPPSHYKNIDTCVLASKKFRFTSNKLEYLTDKLCKKFKKLKHKKFEGFSLWVECLAGNKEAWKEMEKYNKHDVLSLEELYKIMEPWDGHINFNTYTEGTDVVCRCGSKEFESRGFFYTACGKFRRYRCKVCGAWTHDKENLLSKEKRKSLRSNAGV